MGVQTRTLTVKVTPPYPVIVGAKAIAQLEALVAAPTVAVIADTHAYAHHGQRLMAALGSHRAHLFRFSGERNKNLATYGELLEACAEAGLDRESAIIAFGGGVVGDLAGFVAATYLRGIAFYQLPTTLLAMVDASVGGKTGVNLAAGKNLAGAFWQPKAVLADVEVLASLPEAVFREGAVELFKHGLLADAELLAAMAHPEFRPGGDPELLSALIARSIQVKADIVAADERESGRRAHLNLGHTLAHALEAATDHALSHGDAVAYGLLYAGLLAKARGFADETGRIRDFLKWLKPKPLPRLDFNALLPYLQRDKKRATGALRFVLLRAIGEPVMVSDLSEAELRRAWEELIAL